MEAYKFDVKVQENGVLQIPEISRFADQEVEVFILLKTKGDVNISFEQSGTQFLDKWRGLLKGAHPDDLKSQYLQEKYG